MTITTVLLDGGGVILDESEHERVRARIAVETLISIVPDYSIQYYELDVEDAIKCFCPNVYEFVFWKRLGHDRLLFNDCYDRYIVAWRSRRPPLKLMPRFDKEIAQIPRGLAIGIAGQYGREILDYLAQHSLLEHFTHTLTQDDFQITKPDPRFYEQIVEACGAEPRQCIMVGDRVDKDIVPAGLLRMKTVLVRGGLHRNQQPRMPYETPDIELDGITGLANAITELAGRANGQLME